jgi:hypothetical protein
MVLVGGPRVADQSEREKRFCIYTKAGTDGRVDITNITMADEDNNRLESTPTWITWRGLTNNNTESLTYCQKSYLKQRDEEDLKEMIKEKMKQSDERKQKRLKVAEPKRYRVEYSDGIKRVENHKKWKEWINLECGALPYKGRINKKDIPDDETKLMMSIINTMDYNQLAHEHEIRDMNNRKERREVAKALVDMGRGKKRETTGESLQVTMAKIMTMMIASQRPSLQL